MTPHVMKRDGCKVPFNSERIQEAILRAAKAAGVDDADDFATVAEVVSQQMHGRAQLYITHIHTTLENQLRARPHTQPPGPTLASPLTPARPRLPPSPPHRDPLAPPPPPPPPPPPHPP
ncbi:hypothetical protein G6X41_15210, partial [Staphylococcus aureus]|nr:hypothetical protein [Staphylococcus aureus]